MKILFDLLPVILFVAAYQLYDIYVATLTLMAAMPLQLAWMRWSGKPIEKMHWITLALVLVFGGLTLSFRDPLFIMWKPTVINLLLAAAVLGSEWWMKRSFMQRMLHKVAPFPASVCRNLSYAWAIFFILLGVLNLYVAYSFSEAVWVNFKLFGLMGLSLIFALGQGFYLARHMPKPA
ncbi:MAG: septation protein A [Pseudomonadota bacterium]